jgi:hypothetical protein
MKVAELQWDHEEDILLGMELLVKKRAENMNRLSEQGILFS